MRVLDPGHMFVLARYDGAGHEVLAFVKRDTPPEKYPGNTSAYPGTNLQEVLRACLSRLGYLNWQAHACQNDEVIKYLGESLYLLEARAHAKHGSTLSASVEQVLAAEPCATCGHVFCSWCAPSNVGRAP